MPFLDTARSEKHRRYQSFIATSTRGRLVPMPIYIIRGWNLDECAVINNVGRHFLVRAMETYGKVGGFFMQKHVAAAACPIRHA